MQFLRGLHNIPSSLKGTVLTIGNFDGVHVGHQALLRELKRLSAQYQVPSVLITFEPSPAEFFLKEKAEPRLMLFREKYPVIQSMGIDYLLCLPFNKSLSEFSALDFIQYILVEHLKIKAVVVGDDFHFGKKREGDFLFLKKWSEHFNFTAQQLPALLEDQQRISSSRIRKALQKGNFEEAQHLLGRLYTLSGRVIEGKKEGKKLGFPTANINLHRKSPPFSGIFAVMVEGLDKIYPGAAYIRHTTAMNSTSVLLEVHLLNFHENIYGKRIEVKFLKKIRDDQSFSSFGQVKHQIQKDVKIIQVFFDL